MTQLKHLRTNENKEEMRQAYLFWKRQISRCTNPKNNRFQWYGKKGIRVEYSFEEFWHWWLKAEKPDKRFHIGRIDHKKNYTLDNIEIQDPFLNTQEMSLRKKYSKLRKILVIEKKTGKEVMVCFSGPDAAFLFGHSSSTISRQCRGESKPKRTNFIFKELVSV